MVQGGALVAARLRNEEEEAVGENFFGAFREIANSRIGNSQGGSRLSAVLGADLPVYRDNSGTQVMPDYRVRGAVTWRF